MQRNMLKPNHRPCFDIGNKAGCFSDAETDVALRLLRRWKKMCAERAMRTTPSREAETIAMRLVEDEEELVSSCAAMAWTATRAVVVKTASVPSTVGILEGTAIFSDVCKREKSEKR